MTAMPTWKLIERLVTEKKEDFTPRYFKGRKYIEEEILAN
tara:strand:- start:313 stop:432 length:120 start_codon:yes stop_codon:yes gene_type:complete